MKNVLIGIAGGSASGKTTLASTLNDAFDHQVILLKQDNYYKANADMSFEERSKLNFDHPDAFETDLMVADLKRLKRGIPIEHPVYSFIEHTRMDRRVEMKPGKVIIVEGILIFENPALVDLMDIKVYIDTDPDLRFIRRMMRDVNERGRSLESVVSQYLQTAKPMHDRFIAPSKRVADIIIPNNGDFPKVAVDMLVNRIRNFLTEEEPELWQEKLP